MSKFLQNKQLLRHCQYGEAEYRIGSVAPGNFIQLAPNIIVELMSEYVCGPMDILSIEFNFGDTIIRIVNTDEYHSRCSSFISGSLVYNIFGIGSRDSNYLKYRIIRCKADKLVSVK